MKAQVGAFNQEKALVGAFSMIVKTDGLFAALVRRVVPQSKQKLVVTDQDPRVAAHSLSYILFVSIPINHDSVLKTLMMNN